MAETDAGPGLEDLLEYLKTTRGFDFTAYKRNSLMRRVGRRMGEVGVHTYTEYLDYLEVHPDEFTALFNTILINVTAFFRDPEAWGVLRDQVIPGIVAGKAPSEPIRLWSAASASGEEAYSLAIAMAEALGEEEFRERVKIYGTDVDEPALTKARAAMYTKQELENLSEEFLEKYFEPNGERRTFRKELRRSVIFGRHDLLHDAPISRLDLIACRNVLMYFNAEAQASILTRFAFALNSSGYLFLGKAETLLARSDIFAPIDLSHRIFVKPERTRARMSDVILQGQVLDAGPTPAVDRLRDVGLERDSVAQIIVDATGAVIVVNARARGMFGLSQRDAGRPLQDLEVSYRPVELRSLIDRAYAEGQEIVSRDVHLIKGGENHWLDVSCVPLVEESGAVLGAKISFLETTGVRKLQEDLQRSRQELETAYEELQSTNEELQTTNEELQSTIEELETTNEELQSTNEELETMNEELESTNEELGAANNELTNRGDQLNRANAFLESILTSIQVAVVVLDHDLLVQAWNRQAEELWGLRAEEVRGKNFLNLDIGLPVQDVHPMLRAVLTGDAEHRQMQSRAINRRGKPIQIQVSATRIADPDRGPGGLVVLMEEIPVRSGQQN